MCHHVSVLLQMMLAASAALGLTINHAMFLCTRVNEPLVTSVAGSLKNIIMVRGNYLLPPCGKIVVRA